MVALRVNGPPLGMRSVEGLRAGESIDVRWIFPWNVEHTFLWDRERVDIDHQVAESDESDNEWSDQEDFFCL